MLPPALREVEVLAAVAPLQTNEEAVIWLASTSLMRVLQSNLVDALAAVESRSKTPPTQEM